MTSRSLGAWLVISVFYALQYMLRVMPNTFSGVIMEKFSVGAFSLGQFSSFYYIGYTVAQIPLGILMDRYGAKRVVPVCMAITVLGVVPMLFKHWYLVQLGRIMTGVGSAAGALSILKISKMYFGKKFAIMTSISLFIGLIGATYGGMPVLTLMHDYGWEPVLLSVICVGCVLAGISFFVLSDTEILCGKSGVIEQIKPVFFNKKLLIISALGGFMIGPIEGFADGWATAVLKEVCGIASQYATILPSTVFISSGLGSLVWSYLSSRSVDSFLIVIYCGVFTVLAFVLLLTGQCDTVKSSFVILTVIGFCSAYRLATVCKAIECAGNAYVALATAGANMIIMGFGSLYHTAIAAIVNAHWDGIILDGKATYGSEVLVKALLVVPLGSLVGTVGFLIVRTRNNRQKAQNA